MKLYKTIIFIFALLILLGCTAYFFPKNGVNVGPVHLDFPTLQQALEPSAEEQEGLLSGDSTQHRILDPEEQIEAEMQTLEALQDIRDTTFVSFCENSAIRIAMPFKRQVVIDTISSATFYRLPEEERATFDSVLALVNVKKPDLTTQPGDTLWAIYRTVCNEEFDYLDDFFAALENARNEHVRIIHYGDSQIEEDRITSGLREHFQANFGGGGCGLLPAQQWIARMTCSQRTSPELQNHICFGTSQNQIRSHRYGPMAVVAHTGGNAKINVTMTENPDYAHVHDFNRITIIRDVPGSDEVQFLVQDFDEMQHRATVNINGPADIFGVMFDQKTGVSMDNVPMRGSSGNIFTKIDRKTFEPFFQHENVRLIILQYGGNMVPMLGTEDRMRSMCKDLQKQVHYFHEIAPKAKILFIGPSDMATNVGGSMRTYPKLPTFVSLLEEYMTDCGVAFWNMYEAMGGQGSMVRWVNARPQLAGEDYVHFTHKGAKKMSDLLYETLDTYYKYYRFRHGLPIANETETSANENTENVATGTDNAGSNAH